MSDAFSTKAGFEFMERTPHALNEIAESLSELVEIEKRKLEIEEEKLAGLKPKSKPDLTSEDYEDCRKKLDENSLISDEEESIIDKKIEYWHTHDTGNTLLEFLGNTDEVLKENPFLRALARRMDKIDNGLDSFTYACTTWGIDPHKLLDNMSAEDRESFLIDITEGVEDELNKDTGGLEMAVVEEMMKDYGLDERLEELEEEIEER